MAEVRLENRLPDGYELWEDDRTCLEWNVDEFGTTTVILSA